MYAPVTMARLVKENMEWHGVDMKAEDWVLLSFPSANRDPDGSSNGTTITVRRV